MAQRTVPVDELVTVFEIADMLKMSVNSASNIITGRDGRYKLKFPKPLVGRGTRAVWLWTEVESWYEAVGPKTRRRNARATAMTYKRPSWSRGKKTA